jgi:hypothetical protein
LLWQTQQPPANSPSLVVPSFRLLMSCNSIMKFLGWCLRLLRNNKLYFQILMCYWSPSVFDNYFALRSRVRRYKSSL